MQPGINYIGVAVGAAVVSEEGKLFLGLRSKNARNEAGTWEFPGGGVEFAETLEQAVVREIQEEYGFDINIIEQIGICDCILAQDKQHWVAIGFLCKIKKGKPRILEPDRCDGIGWFTLPEAEQLPLNTPSRFELQILKQRYPTGIQKVLS